MTRLLLVLTLLFCASVHGVRFHPCTKPDGGIMYSNIPCECFQFPDKTGVYNAKCALAGMPTPTQQEHASKRKQDLDAQRLYAAKNNREEADKRRIEDQIREIERKKQRVLDEMAQTFKNPRSETYGSMLGNQMSLLQKRLELVAVNNELAAKDRELDKYRSPEEVARLQAARAQARQNRKDALAKLKQEQRDEKMERKIDDIADKLGIGLGFGGF